MSKFAIKFKTKMNGLYTSILTACLIIIIVKIVFIWVKQVYILFACKIPNPGIPLPILGHAGHFLGVSPEETLEVATNLMKQDIQCRKVCIG